MQTADISTKISQAVAFPVQVLMWSAVSRKLWTFMAQKRNTSRDGARMVPETLKRESGLLRGRLLAEVVVIGHRPAHDGVLFPLYRALGEFALRRDDLLEHGIVRRALRHNLVEHFELLLQHRDRGLVELHLVLGLQLDVVLRVAVDGFPRHVL